MKPFDGQLVNDATNSEHGYADGELVPVGGVTEFPFEEIDQERINEQVERQCAETRAETISQIISILLSAEKPRLAASQLAWAGGLYINEGLTVRELAKKFGVSFQDFQKGAMQYAKDLGLDPTRAMKSEESRKTYSQSNHRNNKIK